MTDDVIDFGASDLGGPKHASPSEATTPSTELTNELIKRKAWSRLFALVAVIVMSISALGCLGFAMYVGCHFLKELEKHEEYARTQPPDPALTAATHKQDAATAKVGAQADAKKAPQAVAASEKKEPESESSSDEKRYLSVLAPLIPASFSSALAVILFITIARFVTNFERIGHESSEKEAPEDYGAIAALVQEIGKMIQTLRGK